MEALYAVEPYSIDVDLIGFDVFVFVSTVSTT